MQVIFALDSESEDDNRVIKEIHESMQNKGVRLWVYACYEFDQYLRNQIKHVPCSEEEQDILQAVRGKFRGCLAEEGLSVDD